MALIIPFRRYYYCAVCGKVLYDVAENGWWICSDCELKRKVVKIGNYGNNLVGSQ